MISVTSWVQIRSVLGPVGCSTCFSTKNSTNGLCTSFWRGSLSPFSLRTSFPNFLLDYIPALTELWIILPKWRRKMQTVLSPELGNDGGDRMYNRKWVSFWWMTSKLSNFKNSDIMLVAIQNFFLNLWDSNVKSLSVNHRCRILMDLCNAGSGEYLFPEF